MDDYIDSIIKKNCLKVTKSGLALTEGQIFVLDKYKINYESVKSLSEVLMLINIFMDGVELDDEEYEEIENISQEIAERHYYNETQK